MKISEQIFSVVCLKSSKDSEIFLSKIHSESSWISFRDFKRSGISIFSDKPNFLKLITLFDELALFGSDYDKLIKKSVTISIKTYSFL